jgi:predicted HTH transcriptional regulator
MINKRLLIKNLLAHNDETSFTTKATVEFTYREGKAKFLKHICALSNSNPANNSYIVVGVEDQDNEIIGDDFFDDSQIKI